MGTPRQEVLGRPARLESLNALRGLAALSVTWYHFTQGNSSFLPEGALKTSGQYGWLGVEAFFVISGFVIPLALWRSEYSVGLFVRFMARRLVRLDPPYLAAIGLTLAAQQISQLIPGFRGTPATVSWAQVALHLGYLNAFLGPHYPWLNPVFWTLAVEAQYYVAIGLLFPVVTSADARWASALCVLVLLASVAVPAPALLPAYGPLFVIGVVLFRYWVGLTRTTATFGWSIMAAAFVDYGLGHGPALVGLLTAILIVAIKRPVPGLSALGAISYSLYLVHVPIGGRVVNAGARLADSQPERLLVLGAALAVTMIAATVFAYVIEWPAQEWALAVRIRSGETPAATAQPVTRLR